jgi:16S rRNA G966 N2-methylase RsmD
MSELKKMLLSSIENHGKLDISGLYQIYPHVKKFSVLRNLFLLKKEGWIVIKKTRMVGDVKVKNPNVRISRKQMYKQTKLLFTENIAHGTN